LIMKNLKIKLGLFSLLMILAASVFLTSCEQEGIDETPIYELYEAELSSINTRYVLSKGLIENQQEAVVYMNSADDNTLSKLNENYRIMEFLHNEGLYETIYEDIQQGQHLSDVDLSNYLDVNQLARLKSFSLDSMLISRCIYCASTQHNGGWCLYTCGDYCAAIPYEFKYISPC